MATLTPSAVDRIAIDDLYASYLWAFDAGDTDGYVDCFWPDAVIREDQPDGRTLLFAGADEIRRYVLGYQTQPDWPGHQHRETTRVYRDAGRPDRLLARSYWMTSTFFPEPHEARIGTSGFYRDTLELRDGEWKWIDRWIAPWKGDVIAWQQTPAMQRSSSE